MVESQTLERIRAAVNRQRLLETAIALIDVPSPTRGAGDVADCLAQLVQTEGFEVERPEGEWPQAPAVAVRFDSGRPGRTLQLSGHLDTVHLPFVPSSEDGVHLYGSGSSDMKGGIAINVETLRVLRETGLLRGGSILLTAYDLHERPWGDGHQLEALIRAGYVGDGVLIPEYLCDRLGVAGRGQAVFEVSIKREGDKVHEVLRPPGTPDVIGAGAEIVVRLKKLMAQLEQKTHPHAGTDSVFVGMLRAGEMFNQSPIECRLSGTRRWVTPGDGEEALDGLRELFGEVAADTGTTIEVSFQWSGEAFRLDEADPLVNALQASYGTIGDGSTLAAGNKPFVDDGNAFYSMAGIPALTHGPAATGAHTLDEKVPIDELVRVVETYALAAADYCGD